MPGSSPGSSSGSGSSFGGGYKPFGSDDGNKG
jgi:hypothetical protein